MKSDDKQELKGKQTNFYLPKWNEIPFFQIEIVRTPFLNENSSEGATFAIFSDLNPSIRDRVHHNEKFVEIIPV